MATNTPNFNLIQPEETDPFKDFLAWYNATLAIIDANLGGGGSKHTIIDENGQTLPNRTYLEFTGGVQVTDDAQNNKTLVNITGGGGGSSTLAGLTDVNLTSPTNGQVLTYDNSSHKWINANPSGSMHVYSTTEKVVGEWIDGKPLYEITVDVGALPNRATKSVNYGVADVKAIVKLYGIGIASTGVCCPLPFSDDYSPAGNILLDANASSGTIRLISQSDKSPFHGYVTMQYTKTTD